MTPAEWQDLTQWVDDRWPDGWNPQQQIAFYHDIETYQAQDVWAAIMAIYNRGREFAPTGSVLKAQTIEEARTSAKNENWRQLPAPDPDAILWSVYAQRTYKKPLTIMGAARIEHKKWDGCRSPICDIHKK